MLTFEVGKSAATRLNSGAAILAAARTADTRLIKDRLAAFDRAQQSYAGAHTKLQQAAAELDTAHAQFRTEQQRMIDALARALVADGQPLRRPFGAFGSTTMGAFMRMAPGDAAKVLPELVVTIRNSKTAGKLTLQALQGAEKVTRGMDQALARIETLGTAARNARDAVAQTWDTALGALKRGARAAADDGAATLYATLFGRPARTKPRNHKPAPSPAPPVNPPTDPQPAAS